MSHAGKVLRKTVRRLLMVQCSLIIVVAAAYGVARGWPAATAALYGGGIALFNTLISAQRLSRASEVVGDVRRGMLELYIGAIIRFVATPALIVAGILVLKLDPVAIIVGFAVAQAGYFFNHVQTA